MQQNSIHNPAPAENDSEQNPFPTSGDNFTTLIRLDDTSDLQGLTKAIDFIEDCQIALTLFQQEENRTGTP